MAAPHMGGAHHVASASHPTSKSACTWANVQYLAKKRLLPEDYAHFHAATGTSIEELLRRMSAVPDLDDLLYSMTTAHTRMVGHPLNEHGLHAFRALMQERITDALRHNTTSDKLVEQFRRDGFVLIPYNESLVDGILRRLQHATGWSQPFVGTRSLKFLTMPHIYGDWQQYMHVDDSSQVLKTFVFQAGTTLKNGPLHYVSGSHRNSEGKMRWLFQRSRRLTASVTTPGSCALCLPNGTYSRYGAFDDEMHGTHESLRFAGFDPRQPLGGVDLSPYGLPAPAPMLLADSATAHSMVIADTSGFHYRGYASPGVKRVYARFHVGLHGVDVSRRNPWVRTHGGLHCISATM